MINLQKFKMKRKLLKKMGIGAFLFFLIKGLVWILVGWYFIK